MRTLVALVLTLAACSGGMYVDPPDATLGAGQVATDSTAETASDATNPADSHAGQDSTGDAPAVDATDASATDTPPDVPTDACPEGQTYCFEQECVKLDTDPRNCGACLHFCPSSTPQCMGGVCVGE